MKINKKEHFLAFVEACNRAEQLGVRWENCANPHMTLMLDLRNTLTYEEICKLNDFKDVDFAHDIIGIQNNFNRQTMRMENFFVPRCKG